MPADATDLPSAKSLGQPRWATAALVLADGSVFWGRGAGATGQAVGEVCFNTSITGYQEILTDPSYRRQIVTLTYPHYRDLGLQGDPRQRARQPRFVLHDHRGRARRVHRNAGAVTARALSLAGPARAPGA